MLLFSNYYSIRVWWISMASLEIIQFPSDLPFLSSESPRRWSFLYKFTILPISHLRMISIKIPLIWIHCFIISSFSVQQSVFEKADSERAVVVCDPAESSKFVIFELSLIDDSQFSNHLADFELWVIWSISDEQAFFCGCLVLFFLVSVIRRVE